MATYYKGKLSLTKDIYNNSRITLGYYVNSNSDSIIEYREDRCSGIQLYHGYSYWEQQQIKDYLLRVKYNYNTKTICNDGKILKILKEKHGFNNEVINFSKEPIEIIFELVKDINGNIYGKELYTGKIFPIYDPNKNLNSTFYFEYTLADRKFAVINERKINIPNMLESGSIITQMEYANQNEVDEYLNMFKTGLFKEKKKIKFIETINCLFKTNIFKEDFKLEEKEEKKDVVREKQSSGTLIMEDIEYLLSNLKSNNNDLYMFYRNRYEELLKESNLSYQMLAIFLGELEASLLFKKEGIEDIMVFFNDLKKEYLFNYLNQESKKTDLTFEKINKMNELFLKIKDKYSLVNQRKVIKDLAFLYIMEVYENKDTITLEELENSYFKDNLKSIIICLKGLSEIGLIKLNYSFDLVEELNCGLVLDIIRNIKFNKIQEEQANKLVKRLGNM